jgi:hypothetical protein
MADLVKAVSKTVFPNGMTQVYENGALIKKQPTDRLNVWYRWLHILKVKHNWQ